MRLTSHCVRSLFYAADLQDHFPRSRPVNMSISRRRFLTGVATAGALVAAPTFVPSSVLGRAESGAPQ